MEKQPLKIYFAGDLFDAKDLGGNLLLADAIEKCSSHRYRILLPQEGECEVGVRSAENIRDADFELLFESDLILANFDGPDLDSGTVAEFCFAKMVDMPALLLRTDFRDTGDSTLPDGDPWNLMCSCYPRTSVLFLNAMERYHQCKQPDRMAFLNGFYSSIAKDIIRELDKLVTRKSWLGSERVYDQLAAALQSIGGSLHKRFDAPRLKALADAKKNSGLY